MRRKKNAEKNNTWKPTTVYIKHDGKWLKVNTFVRQNGEWLKVKTFIKKPENSKNILN